MNNLHTIYMNMPPDVKGFVIKTFDEDEHYTIVLNPAYNYEQQCETYKHELKHISCHDLDMTGDADVIEMLRHA